MHPLGCTDDFTYTMLFISPKMLDDLRFQTFSHDHEKFNYAPICSLTDDQAAYLLGSSEPTSFYRFFKRVAGVTAKQYRDGHQ